MEQITDLDAWLLEKEQELKNNGYKRFIQHHKSEDFAHWKVFYDGEEKIYQVGVLFYDFRKYAHYDETANRISNRISIQYECMILCDNRIDLSVSKSISIKEFEDMAKAFYTAMLPYTSTAN